MKSHARLQKQTPAKFQKDREKKEEGVALTKHPLIVLLDFSLSVKAATLIFISGRGSANSYAKEGKSGFIDNMVRS